MHSKQSAYGRDMGVKAEPPAQKMIYVVLRPIPRFASIAHRLSTCRVQILLGLMSWLVLDMRGDLLLAFEGLGCVGRFSCSNDAN
jgi:hypothetical protein